MRNMGVEKDRSAKHMVVVHTASYYCSDLAAVCIKGGLSLQKDKLEPIKANIC